MTLYYTPSAINTISAEGNIIVVRNSGAVWSPLPGVLDQTNKNVTLNGLSSFSLFAFIDKNAYSVTANVKVFLEGPYSAGTMAASLNSVIPLNSSTAYPILTFPNAASKVVAAIPNVNVVDWVLVELRTSTTAASSVATVAGFLLNTGAIVDVDGTSPLNFPGITAGSYYVVIRHRNHLAIMSATPIALSGASALYDFTTAQTQAYGTNPMATLTGPVYGMFTGDANGDGQITSTDFNIFIPKYWAILANYYL